MTEIQIDNNHNIFDLPPELLLNIFRFLDVRTLYSKVCLVCKYFHEVLTSKGIWQSLFALKWEETKFTQDLSYICSWNKVYMSFEDIDTFWKNKDANEKLKRKQLRGHFGTVDAVHIMESKRIIVSGSRDRTALIWNVGKFLENDFESNSPLEPEVLNHNGWVWAIGSDPKKSDQIVTTSWDTKVKIWNLENISLVNTLEYHTAPILSICCRDDILTTGCYDKKLRQYDTKSNTIVREMTHHKRPVLSLQMTDTLIFSGSDDKTIGIYDMRADKLLTRLRLDSPALCMNLGIEQGLNYLKVGGKNGSLFVFDVSDGNRFSLLNTFDLWTEPKKITGITNYRGCLMACSEGGTIRAYSPDRNCTFIKTFDDIHEGKGVTSCCSNGNIMMTGGEDCSVCLWKFVDL